MKKLHLLSNAHLDPVWQWEWEEGAAAAVSTFRAAADFCEEFDGYVFNHNEVILYKWVEEYEPTLFKRIQRLVGEGKWHIMGGWYLQPDCNMPSGESFVRQILHGKTYFKEKFDVEPSTAINFDSFGQREPNLLLEDGNYRFITDDLQVTVNASTGLIDEYVAGGMSYLQPDAFSPLVIEDNEDPWRMDTNAFPNVIGKFALMDAGAGTDFSGVKSRLLPSVRVIEDGEVRTVIESVLAYRNSSICLTYKLPKQGTEIEVQVRVYWNEKDKMLKLSIPTFLTDGAYIGQTAFGAHALPDNGEEAVAQKWVSVESSESSRAITCINNGVYGSDFHDGEIRITLLRGSAYCAHPINDRPIVVQDRFLPRIDQGERNYTFWINGGELAARRAHVDREADAHNEKPFALSFFPSGDGQQPDSYLLLDGGTVQLSAFKKEERGEGYVIRLFEPTGSEQTTTLSIPSLGIREEVRLNGHEIRTYRFDVSAQTLQVIGLCEKY